MKNVFAKRKESGQVFGMKSILKDYIEEHKITGMAACIIKDGKIIWKECAGYADVSKKKPVTADTSFVLASIGKTFTAVAAMTLVEKGKLNLKDDVNEYLPFEVRNPNYPDEPITVEMLMTHTSSIIDDRQYNMDDALVYFRNKDPKITLAEYVEKYITPDGEYYVEDECFSKEKPGKKYSYSNAGVALLGLIIERVSEMGCDEFCRKKIWSPLGMKNTAWRLADLDMENASLPFYEYHKTKGHYNCPDYPNGLYKSSLSDLAKFLMMFMQDGTYDGETIISEKTAKLMKKEHFSDDENSVGLIWCLSDDLIGHDGAEEGSSTTMWYDTESNIGVIILCNQSDVDLEDLYEEIYEMADEDSEGSEDEDEEDSEEDED
ncbi:MAG TPA: serine hydrolase domain-containing protein [Leptospiraceae bacterium]|nr:serine hydrolase domain-containing protein [Leptospiraceae bacterium]HNF13764.1 serine hydrolase domain-containing protein [Leptospiraceae bacterium]HNF24840.1 serine hydrolase domain-containing protein [Leptospiraceae bacterium]